MNLGREVRGLVGLGDARLGLEGAAPGVVSCFGGGVGLERIHNIHTHDQRRGPETPRVIPLISIGQQIKSCAQLLSEAAVLDHRR